VKTPESDGPIIDNRYSPHEGGSNIPRREEESTVQKIDYVTKKGSKRQCE